jgi:hypothetical protein
MFQFNAQFDFLFDHNARQFNEVPASMVEFCHVCGDCSNSVDMGVFGVHGDFFCSMECHDSVECRRQAVVFVFVHDGMGNDGRFVDCACSGVQANPEFRCPECDARSNGNG